MRLHVPALGRRMAPYRTMYLFLVPAILTTIVFYYLPMVGVVMAFENYHPIKGFFGSEFVGFQHFHTILGDPKFYAALKNTLGISCIMIFIGFPLPILLALFINEIKDGPFKRVTQSISYLPHFISWVVIASLVYRMLEYDFGNVNMLISSLGGEKIAFFRNPKYFWGILTTTAIWKELGWNTIIYLAALSGVDSQLYEAAEIDGAGRFRKLISVTLPGIMPTITLMFIFALGGLLTSVNGAGFEAVMNMQNAMVAERSTTLDYYVYYQGLRMNQMSLAAAVGLMQSLCSITLVVATNAISRKVRGYGVF